MPYPSIDCHDEYHSYAQNDDENQSRNRNSSIEINNDFESAIRNLRPLAIQQKQIQIDIAQTNRLLTKENIQQMNSKDFTRNHPNSSFNWHFVFVR